MDIPDEVRDAMLLLEFGQSFALTNFHHEETRRDVKKLKKHIDIIRDYLISIGMRPYLKEESA